MQWRGRLYFKYAFCKVSQKRRSMNKSLLTNLLAGLVVVIGIVVPSPSDVVFMTGLFALSGGLTNWLAVHMLFEKIPFLYGSGVVPTRFEEFKAGIKVLIIQEFFSREHVERFLSNADANFSDRVLSGIDFDDVFEKLVDAIEESSLGKMLGMIGGRSGLLPLKEPVIKKLHLAVEDVVESLGKTDSGDNSAADVLVIQIESIIDNRLAELTPEKVKKIVEEMIRRHLGWLVVWGGVFGGAIGFLFTLLDFLL